MIRALAVTGYIKRRLLLRIAPLAAMLGASALIFPASASATSCSIGDICFTGGPSVRVNPDVSVEFKWTTGVAWYGRVDIFDNPDATGSPLVTKFVVDNALNKIAATQQDLVNLIVSPLAADTTYYFRVSMVDPTGTINDLAAPASPPLPSFFTGAQALSNVQVVPGTTSAQVSWQGNVIGFGQVQYGTSAFYGQTQADALNVTDHALTLTGLQPATAYVFEVCNVHAIDGDCLASSTGSFTTLATLSDQFLSPLVQSTDPANAQINTGKNGKVVPVKVQISQGATQVTNLNAPGPVTIKVSGLACNTTAGSDPVTSYADAGQSSAGTNQFNYDSTAQAWVYNLDTKALGLITGNCYRIDVAVNGTQITNAFAAYQPTK